MLKSLKTLQKDPTGNIEPVWTVYGELASFKSTAHSKPTGNSKPTANSKLVAIASLLQSLSLTVLAKQTPGPHFRAPYHMGTQARQRQK